MQCNAAAVHVGLDHRVEHDSSTVAITGVAKDEGYHLTGVALRKMRNFICRDVEQRRAIPYVASTSAAPPL